MRLTRRGLLGLLAGASSALATKTLPAFEPSSNAAIERDGGPSPEAGSQSTSRGTHAAGAPFRIPSTMPMGSGAPLGGIGTGFVEIRADGCFHEWQIFNSGPWAQNARSATAPPAAGPQYLRFLLRTKKASDEVAQVRRLYLRSDESDLYTLPFVQDVESIDFDAWFPMTGLRYNDSSIPVRASAHLFSPFIPGSAQDSGTPGFHVVYTLENVCAEPVEVSLAGFMDNPLASALAERRLDNYLSEDDGVTSIIFDTSAQTDFPSGIGNMCFSVTGGEHSFIGGTFQEYLLPGTCRWETPRVNYMLLSVLHEFAASGRLPSTKRQTDPSIGLPTAAEIDALSAAEVQLKVSELATDALLARVFSDARSANANQTQKNGMELMNEVRKNLLNEKGSPRLVWGSGALASRVKLAPGEKVEIRFTLSWYFPHHLTTDGREMGHMYANWHRDAAGVNRYLCAHYKDHRAITERFAATLADSSLGDAMTFAWSSQLSTLVFNTWWAKDGSYAIWEGLGCCGLSTTDVDYQGSFPIVALFPELKLSQMKQVIALQNSLGQVPHNYAGSFDRVDDSGFTRVDMNPQFVMMVYRDYLWTGDQEYLQFMWPHVLHAMAFTESLDSNSDGLPDRDTGYQTYDQWRMRGTPSYIASLWIGALRAAQAIAKEAGRPEDAARWSEQLVKASATFDNLLFNGQYFSLWVDREQRDELCMTDQVSGEWFTHLIGLASSTSTKNLDQSIDSIFKNNFNPEFGLHNATAPRRGAGLLALNNLQAGGLWSGIEFAFASLLMDHGRYADGVRIVDAIHRRYLRAGQLWNHVECGGHYSRAMSSWATLLAATGFKPDVPNRCLTIIPAAPGDFRAPWVTASGFGTISRKGRTLSIHCAYGKLDVDSLRLPLGAKSVSVGTRLLAAPFTNKEESVILEFLKPLSLVENQTLSILSETTAP